MHNRISVITGIESCIDLKAEMSPESIGRLSKSTKSGLAKELSLAFGALSKGRDGEIAADGKDITALASEIRANGAKITTDLGGNPAISSSQLISLGARVHFTGNIFRREKEMLSGELFFKKACFEFAEESGKAPASLVLQHKSSRFIICEGRGRRIGDLRKCIAALPETAMSIAGNERVSAVFLPSWHVIFAGGITEKDSRISENALQAVKKSGIPMFTETGSFEGMSDGDVARLWRIYGRFDVIGMNEFEFHKLCDVLGAKKGKGIHKRLAGLLEKSGAHTIWLHSKDFQASVSRKICAEKLGDAEKNASAAGVLRIEEDCYPSEKKINERKNSGQSIGKIPEMQLSGLPHGINFSITPCFKLERGIKSEAGAGDVSAATYLWSLLSLQNHSE